MFIFLILLFLILVNGIVLGRYRKLFVATTFFTIILIAGLRKYTVGTDLRLHYADQYFLISHLSWNQIINFSKISNYDIGFIIYMKILGLISDNPQIFIIVSSIIIYGAIAQYVYTYSSDVVLETFLLYSSFTIIMYLNIIAQAIAIAIVIIGMKHLFNNNYLRYLIYVIVATLIHRSAIICITYIIFINFNKKIKLAPTIALFTIGLLSLDRVVSILTRTIFIEYSVYFNPGSYHGMGVKLSPHSIFQMSFHLVAIVMYYLYLRKSDYNFIKEDKHIVKRDNVVNGIGFNLTYELPTNFLVIMSASSLVVRLISHQSYIYSRIGFYFYFFSFTLISRSISSIKSRQNKLLIIYFIYTYMIIMFLLFYKANGIKAYGVLPYEFFWQ